MSAWLAQTVRTFCATKKHPWNKHSPKKHPAMSDITLRKGTHKYRTIKIYNMPYVSLSLRKRYIANLTTDVKPLITRKQTENICSYDVRFLNFF